MASKVRFVPIISGNSIVLFCGTEPVLQCSSASVGGGNHEWALIARNCFFDAPRFMLEFISMDSSGYLPISPATVNSLDRWLNRVRPKKIMNCALAAWSRVVVLDNHVTPFAYFMIKTRAGIHRKRVKIAR